MDVNLVLFKKNGSKKSFSLPSNATVIGRRHDCDLYIPLKPVSRKHCELSKNDGMLRLRDLGSRNGTYVNGERVDEKPIVAGDYIQIPPITLLVQIDGEPAKIVPPTPAEERAPTVKKKAVEKKPPEQEEPPAQPDLDDSFADLDFEGSDSFLDDLENL